MLNYQNESWMQTRKLLLQPSSGNRALLLHETSCSSKRLGKGFRVGPLRVHRMRHARTWPEVTSYSRMSRRSRVDLPLPDAPTMAQEVPGVTETLTPFKTSRSPAGQTTTDDLKLWGSQEK